MNTEQIMSLVQRLRTNLARIYLGPERLIEAANALEALVQERDNLKDRLDSSVHWHNQTFDLCKLLEQERDAAVQTFTYQKGKIERLQAELADIKAQEPVAWLTPAGKPVVLDQASSEQAKLYGWEALITRSKS